MMTCLMGHDQSSWSCTPAYPLSVGEGKSIYTTESSAKSLSHVLGNVLSFIKV